MLRPDTAKTDKTFAIGMAEPLPPPKEQTEEPLGVLDEEEFSEQASSSYPSMKPRIAVYADPDISRSFPGISSTHITDHPTSGITTSSSDSSFDSDGVIYSPYCFEQSPRTKIINQLNYYR